KFPSTSRPETVAELADGEFAGTAANPTLGTVVAGINGKQRWRLPPPRQTEDFQVGNERESAPVGVPRRAFAGLRLLDSYFGSSTRFTTWITPFDCMTS